MSGNIHVAHLIERIIKGLVQVLQVHQHHCLTSLHTDLDSVDVAANLQYVKHTFYFMTTYWGIV